MANPIVSKAEAAAAAAKLEVKRVKALLKQARKIAKASKKAVKEARRKAKAETVADAKAKGAVAKTSSTSPVPAQPKAARGKSPAAVPAITVRKPRPPRVKPAQTLRSAAEVAKTVIERLQSPPPVLAPPPVIPPAKAVLTESTGGSGHDAGEETAEH